MPQPLEGQLAKLMLLATALLAACAAASGAPEPLVGFVNHFPWIDRGMDEVARSGSNAVIFRAVAGMEAEDGKLDFSSIDRQIEFAEKNGLKIVLLLEANPIYVPSWLRKKCEEAGEMQMTVWGKPDSMPSMLSPIFDKWHRGFVKAVIDHVKTRDAKRVVAGYQPGAEWWYDAAARCSPLDVSAFRRWLAEKYGSLAAFTAAWGSDYRGFEEVDSPRLVMETFLGAANGLADFVPGADLYHDVSWSTHTDLPVTAGREYVFRARFRTMNVRGDGAHLSIAWRDGKDGVALATSNSDRFRGSGGWREVSLTAKAPEGASSAWILLKMRGNGRVDFDSVFFGEKGSSTNLAPNPDLDRGSAAPEHYFFDNWTGGKQASGRYLDEAGDRYVSISIEPEAREALRYRNPRAAAYDWSVFSYEFLGDYIERFCKLVKDCDPSRLTVGYLTYSFAFPVEWDYTMQSAMALDVVLPKLKHLDVIGMQICSADGDPVRITGAIDLARKYGKRVFPIDLLDFTSGVAVGYRAMDAVTQCAAQHGATGAFYYCWYGTPDYNFHTGMPSEDLGRMLNSARESMAVITRRKLTTRAAVVQPILPYAYAAGANEFRDFPGLYKAVLDLQLCPDIWTVTELAAQFPDLRKRYDVVFLPDCAWCPAKAADVLRRFARGGGTLVSSGRLPAFNEIGAPLPASVRLQGLVEMGSGFGSAYLGPVFRTTHAGNTPPLFIETTEPAKQRASRRARLTDLDAALDRAGLKRPVRLSEPGVGCSVFVGGGEKLFFFTNRSSLSELHGLRLSPGPGFRFAGIEGARIARAKRVADTWRLDLSSVTRSFIVRFVPDR